MKLRFKQIEVRMGQGVSIIRINVPEWEVPIVQSIHGETTEIKDIVEDREAISVSSEFSRLQLAYGAERKEGGITGIPYVEAVYGQGGIGITRLRQAILAARLPSDTPVTPPEMSPELRQDLIRELTDTPGGISDLIGDMGADEENLETEDTLT